jgi:hypothetical protein
MLLTDVLEQEEGRMEGQEEKVREKAYLLCKEYLQVCTFRPGIKNLVPSLYITVRSYFYRAVR